MKRIESASIVILLWVACCALLCADEGMWLPHQMPGLDLKSLGLQMNPADLYKTDGTGLMSAVVYLGGGTGEFVSPQGLILTNHHVAYGAIQRAADKEHDYIRNGFYAERQELEIPAVGYIADILLGYEDVTSEITKVLRPGQTPRQRYQAIELQQKRLVHARENKGKDLACSVRSMYSGNQYWLFTCKRLKDIRLVYVPPLALGNFGGEVDNWMWPRHTCDFTFIRAYVSKENIGVEYDKANVPYQPRSFMKISLDGFREKDFTFILGYPGCTYRNDTAAEAAQSFDSQKKRIQQNRDLITFLEKASQNDRSIEIKYASRVRELYNSLKNSEAKLEGIEKYSLAKRLATKEQYFQAWGNSDPGRQKKYGASAAAIQKFLDAYRPFSDRQEAAKALTGANAPTLVGQACLIFRLAEEMQKPDLQREPGFQERDLPAIRQRLKNADRSFDVGVDRELCKYTLSRIYQLYPGQIPAALSAALPVYAEKAAGVWVDRLYERTLLKNPERRLKLLDLTLPQLLGQNDPLIALAAELEKELQSFRETEKGLSQELADLKKVYQAGLLEMNQNRLAPDANGTLRFTYGPVAGYSPRDGVYYLAQTTLSGVLEKDTGREPFDVPEKLKAICRVHDFGIWRDPKLADVPACFLNATNVTGGNSGSPVLNAKGEQIGIIFDMTYESVVGDYFIIPELQRSVAVDIRYVLFIADKFTGAKRLLQEMGIGN